MLFEHWYYNVNTIPSVEVELKQGIIVAVGRGSDFLDACISLQ